MRSYVFILYAYTHKKQNRTMFCFYSLRNAQLYTDYLEDLKTWVSETITPHKKYLSVSTEVHISYIFIENICFKDNNFFFTPVQLLKRINFNLHIYNLILKKPTNLGLVSRMLMRLLNRAL